MPAHQPTFALEAPIKAGLWRLFADSPGFDSEDLHQDPSVYPRRSQAAPRHQCASVKPPASWLSARRTTVREIIQPNYEVQKGSKHLTPEDKDLLSRVLAQEMLDQVVRHGEDFRSCRREKTV